MISFPRLFRPSAAITIAGTLIQDINLPPPAPRGPRIAFRVRRDLTSTADTAEVSIYNLAPERERLLCAVFHELGRAPLQVSAGYESILSLLFSGDIRSILGHVRSGPDYALVLTADDAGDALAELSTSYSTAGWTARNMIDAALLRLNAGDPIQKIAPYPIVEHEGVAKTIAAAGAAASGTMFSGVGVSKVADLLDEAARICKARWWVAGGVLYMAARRLPVDGLAIVLPRKLWLQEPSDDGAGVVRHSVMFDPNLIPGRQVSLVDPTFRRSPAPELFRVESVEFAGDTRSGPWSADLALRRML
jgi:hypothetical protein